MQAWIPEVLHVPWPRSIASREREFRLSNHEICVPVWLKVSKGA
jgi:hypothetical protein